MVLPTVFIMALPQITDLNERKESAASDREVKHILRIIIQESIPCILHTHCTPSRLSLRILYAYSLLSGPGMQVIHALAGTPSPLLHLWFWPETIW